MQECYAVWRKLTAEEQYELLWWKKTALPVLTAYPLVPIIPLKAQVVSHGSEAPLLQAAVIVWDPLRSQENL